MARKNKQPAPARKPREFHKIRDLLNELQNDIDHLYIEALVTHDEERTKEHSLIRQGFEMIFHNLDSSSS